MRVPLRSSLLGCALLVACGGEQSALDRQAVVTRDSLATGDSVVIRVITDAGEAADERPAPFAVDVEPELVIGTEAGDPEYELHRVFDAIRWPDGRIVVGNSGTHELRIFDSAGAFIERLGRRGAGPGEFEEFASIRLHAWADSLLATDDFRVHVYGPSLAFVGTRPFDVSRGPSRPFLAGVHRRGDWLAQAAVGGGAINGPPGSIITMQFELLRYTRDGSMQRSLLTFDGRPRYVVSAEGRISFPYIPLTAELLFAAFGDSAVVLREGQPELQWIDAMGRVTQVARWPRTQVPAREVYPRYVDSSLAGLRRGTDRSQEASYAALYATDLPLPEYAPLYTTLKVDDERRIWLERFRLPGDTGPGRWDVIAPTGEWLGTVDLPPRFTLFRAGRDYVLGRSLDSLGVERVQRHRVRPVPGR